MKVVFLRRCERDLRRLRRQDASRARDAVESFAAGSREVDVKALRGVPGGWLKIGVGDLRVIVRQHEGRVEVARIVNRRDLERVAASLRR